MSPQEVVQLLTRLEPRLAAGAVQAEEAGGLWELRFEMAGRSHRLRLDPAYIEGCLGGPCGGHECEHLRGLLDEICGYLEGSD
jgi:hypothetical protein